MVGSDSDVVGATLRCFVHFYGPCLVEGLKFISVFFLYSDVCSYPGIINISGHNYHFLKSQKVIFIEKVSEGFMKEAFLLANGLVFSLCDARTSLTCPFLALASFVFLV